MSWQFTPFALLYVAGLVIAVALAIVAWRTRPVRATTEFSLLSASVAVWILGYILGFFNTDLAWKLIAVRIEYLGIIFSPTLFLMFVVAYVQLRPARGWQLVLFAPVSLMLVAVLTFPYHDLVYQNFGTVVADGGFVIFAKVYGPLFYFWMAFSYVTMTASFFVLAWGIGRMSIHHRYQATLLGVIITTILISNLAFVSGFNPIAPYDPTPLAFLVACTLVLLNMRSFPFLDIVPVAYNLVFDQVPTGVVVLNERDHVIEMNGLAETIFGAKRHMLGQDLEPWLDVKQSAVKSLSIGPANREFDVEMTPLTDDSGRHAGRLVLLHDVTERNEMSVRQDALIAELREALANVRKLEGILPICANCKKIRGDEDAWQDLEEFIHDHSDAQFSHGICPGCEKLLYPEFQSDR